jgi:hypothetical protein
VLIWTGPRLAGAVFSWGRFQLGPGRAAPMWAADASTMRAISAPALGYVRWVALRRAALAVWAGGPVPPSRVLSCCAGWPNRLHYSRNPHRPIHTME